jgi:hypothetical protein
MPQTIIAGRNINIPMKLIDLKQEIHGYIEQVDDKTLEAIRILMKPGIEQLQLTKEQKAELDKRRKNHLMGKSKSYTWDETEKMVKSKKR